MCCISLCAIFCCGTVTVWLCCVERQIELKNLTENYCCSLLACRVGVINYNTLCVLNISPSLRSGDILHIALLLRNRAICGNIASRAGGDIPIHTGVIVNITAAGQKRICGRRRLDGVETASRRRPDGIRLDGVRKNLRKFGKNCLRRGTDGIRRCWDGV